MSNLITQTIDNINSRRQRHFQQMVRPIQNALLNRANYLKKQRENELYKDYVKKEYGDQLDDDYWETLETEFGDNPDLFAKAAQSEYNKRIQQSNKEFLAEQIPEDSDYRKLYNEAETPQQREYVFNEYTNAQKQLNKNQQTKQNLQYLNDRLNELPLTVREKNKLTGYWDSGNYQAYKNMAEDLIDEYGDIQKQQRKELETDEQIKNQINYYETILSDNLTSQEKQTIEDVASISPDFHLKYLKLLASKYGKGKKTQKEQDISPKNSEVLQWEANYKFKEEPDGTRQWYRKVTEGEVNKKELKNNDDYIQVNGEWFKKIDNLVPRLQDRMTASQFDAWQKYYDKNETEPENKIKTPNEEKLRTYLAKLTGAKAKDIKAENTYKSMINKLQELKLPKTLNLLTNDTDKFIEYYDYLLKNKSVDENKIFQIIENKL
ncbi:MAG TPA: hypothetical protein DHM37_00675 [Candidatus Cloacimonas sp.]|jgi:hypothetical protein|nr:hypothetical protein [Candidatus Cloacimonas sp.]